MHHSEDMKRQDLFRFYREEFDLNETEAMELCQTLEEGLRNLRQSLAEGLREADRVKVTRVGHSLKGLAAQSNLTILADRGAALEAAGEAQAEYAAIAGDVIRRLDRWLTTPATSR